MPASLLNSSAAAVKALQAWYGADSYAASTGLYTWDASDAEIASNLGFSQTFIPIIKATGNWDALRDTARWWNSANAITALVDYMLLTRDLTYLPVVDNTFSKAPGAYTINVGGAVAGGIGGAVAGALAGAALCDGPCSIIGGIVGGILGGSPSTDPIARTYYTNFLDQYYDDEGWWALAWIKAFDLTGDSKYLNQAVTIFNDMTGGWDGTCNGGLYWSKSHTDTNNKSPYKNAIANELFLAVAAALYIRLSDTTSYLNWANQEWQWFQGSKLINAQWLINDSLTTSQSPPPCRNDGSEPVWTYNQGVILGAFCDLASITGNQGYLATAEKIADAVIANPVSPNGAPPESGVDDNGILTEYSSLSPNESVDNCQFKGIFVRNLGYLCKKTHNSRYSAFLKKNAAFAIHFLNGLNQFGHRWDAPIDEADFVRQTAGVDLLNAALAAQAIAPDLSFLEILLLNDKGGAADVSYLDLLLPGVKGGVTDASYADTLLPTESGAADLACLDPLLANEGGAKDMPCLDPLPTRDSQRSQDVLYGDDDFE